MIYIVTNGESYEDQSLYFVQTSLPYKKLRRVLDAVENLAGDFVGKACIILARTKALRLYYIGKSDTSRSESGITTLKEFTKRLEENRA